MANPPTQSTGPPRSGDAPPGQHQVPAYDAKALTVKIFSPYQTYYEGPAQSVSAINKTGPFDVLLQHASFFSILTSGDVKVNTGTEEKALKVEGRGVIRVNNNQVTVFMRI